MNKLLYHRTHKGAHPFFLQVVFCILLLAVEYEMKRYREEKYREENKSCKSFVDCCLKEFVLFLVIPALAEETSEWERATGISHPSFLLPIRYMAMKNSCLLNRWSISRSASLNTVPKSKCDKPDVKKRDLSCCPV